MITAKAGSLQGDGGGIYLGSGYDGSGILTVKGDISANGSGSGYGGTVWFEAPTMISSGGVVSHLSANGGSSGTGGWIHLQTRDQGGDINIGGPGSQFLLSATGGSAGASSGEGGLIEIVAGGNLNVNGANALNVDALGNEGAGGWLFLNAGCKQFSFGFDQDGKFAPSYQLYDQGTLNISSGTYAVTGAGSSSGGVISLIAPTINSSPVAPATAISLQAQGGSNVSGSTSGAAGTISIRSTGDINLDSTNINASAGSNSISAGGTVDVVAGGSLSISSTTAPVEIIRADGGANGGSGGAVTLQSGGSATINNAIVSVEAGHSGNGAGGQLVIDAGLNGSGDLNVSAALIADGNGNGAGGTLTANSHSGSATFSHPVSSSTAISATGGSFDGQNADGGHISIQAAGDLNLQSGDVDVSSLAQNGNGGVVHVQSLGNSSIGTVSAKGNGSGSGGVIEIDSGLGGSGHLTAAGTITASATGSGNGGMITLNSAGPITVNDVSADAMGDGAAGSISFGTPVGSALNVTLNGAVSANSSGGTEGSINFSNSNGGISVTGGGSLGGNVSASGESINLSLTGGTAQLDIESLTATGGNISINLPNTTTVKFTDTSEVIASAGTSGPGNITVVAGGIVYKNGCCTILADGTPHLESTDPTKDQKISGRIEGRTSVEVITHGSANIVNAGGTIVAPLVVFRTETGSIGSTGGAIQIQADKVQVTSNGGAMFRAEDSRVVTLLSSSGVDRFILEAPEITVQSGSTVSASTAIRLTANGLSNSIAVAGNLTTTNADGFVNLHANDISSTGGLIQSTDVTLEATAGSIGAVSNPVMMRAAAVRATASQDVFLQNQGSIEIVEGKATQGTFGLTTVDGSNGSDITVRQALTAGSQVSLLAQNGSVFLNNDIRVEDPDSGRVSISVTGTGNIVSGGGLISANGVTLNTVSGSIGDLAGSIFINAGTLSFNSTSNGSTANVSVSSGSFGINNLTIDGKGFDNIILACSSTRPITVNELRAQESIQMTVGLAGLIGRVFLNGPISTISLLGFPSPTSEIVIQADEVTGTGIITTNRLELTSQTQGFVGTFGSSGSPMQTDVGSLALNFSGDVFVSNRGSLNLSSVQKLGEFVLLNQGGSKRFFPGIPDINIRSLITAADISMTTFDNGSIFVDNVLVADNSMNLSVQNSLFAPFSTGSITTSADVLPVSLLVAPNLNLNTAGTGNIAAVQTITLPDGTQSTIPYPLGTSTTSLAIQSNGYVSIANFGNPFNLLEVQPSSSAGVLFSLVSTSSILVNSLKGGVMNIISLGRNVDVSTGSVIASAGGIVLAAPNGNITVGTRSDLLCLNGSITLSAGNQITLNANSLISANSTSSDLTQGNVHLFAGPISSLELASPLDNFLPNGLVLWNPQTKVNALAPTNLASGIGRSVALSSATKGGITLGGGVIISALGATKPGAAGFAPGASSPNNPGGSVPPGPPNFSQPPGFNNNPGQTNSLPPGQQLQNSGTPGQQKKASISSGENNPLVAGGASSEFIPVAFTSYAGLLKGHVYKTSMPTLSMWSGDESIRMQQNKDAKRFVFTRSDALIDAKESVKIQTLFGDLGLSKGSIVLVALEGTTLHVYNLHDSRKGSVVFACGERQVQIAPGENLIFSRSLESKSDGVSRRRLERITLKGSPCFISEFSLVSIFEARTLLSKVRINHEKLGATTTLAKVLKTAVCINAATSAHGPYRNETCPIATQSANPLDCE